MNPRPLLLPALGAALAGPEARALGAAVAALAGLRRVGMPADDAPSLARHAAEVTR